jgi:hypothetical protein
MILEVVLRLLVLVVALVALWVLPLRMVQPGT